MPMQHQPAGVALRGEYGGRHGAVVLAAGVRRAGDEPAGEDDRLVVAQARGRAGDDAVLADTLVGPTTRTSVPRVIAGQAGVLRRPMIAKRSFPDTKSIAATATRIISTIKATWSKS